MEGANQSGMLALKIRKMILSPEERSVKALFMMVTTSDFQF